MTIGDLRRFRNAVPFVPIMIFLSDGNGVALKHPENLALIEDAKTAFLYEGEHDFRFISLDHITEIAPLYKGSISS